MGFVSLANMDMSLARCLSMLWGGCQQGDNAEFGLVPLVVGTDTK